MCPNEHPAVQVLYPIDDMGSFPESSQRPIWVCLAPYCRETVLYIDTCKLNSAVLNKSKMQEILDKLKSLNAM